MVEHRTALLALFVLGGMLTTRRTARAQSEINPCFFSTGPIGMVRNQTTRHIFFLPAVQRGEQNLNCRLLLHDTEGDLLVDTTFSLAPGSFYVGDLTVLADGSVRYNNEALKIRVPDRQRLEINPCWFVGNMQKGVPVVATAQCAPNLNNPTTQNTDTPIVLGATTYMVQYHDYGEVTLGL